MIKKQKKSKDNQPISEERKQYLKKIKRNKIEQNNRGKINLYKRLF